MTAKKNDIITLNIEGITHDGFGVGRKDGFAIFVPLTAVGDICEVKILKVEKSFAFGKIEKIITLSSTRIEQDCPVYEKCGGCSFRHISYEEELRIKREKVQNAFSRIAKLDINVLPVIGSDNISCYRNKAQYPVGHDGEKVKIGFYGFHSHNIIDIDSCNIQDEAFTKVTRAFREWMDMAKVSLYDETTGMGLLRHIYARTGRCSGEVMACAVINGNDIPQKELLISLLKEKVQGIVSIIININTRNTNVILGDKTITIWGKSHIVDILDGLKFNISPLSFFQVNPAKTVKLYNKAIELAGLTGEETVLDLYCGIGTISLFLAQKAKKVYGVEISPEAIANAKENARINNLTNVEFICSTAEDAAKMLKQNDIHPDVITADPPRKGLEKGLIDTIAQMSPKRIIYISCDPATLARDVKLFGELGYNADSAQPVDMFSRTYHVECIILITRDEKH